MLNLEWSSLSHTSQENTISNYRNTFIETINKATCNLIRALVPGCEWIISGIPCDSPTTGILVNIVYICDLVKGEVFN